MRTVTRFLAAFILLCALMLFPLQHNAQNPSAAGYHDHAALSKALQQLAQQHPRIIQLKSIGKSLKGRDIWMIQMSGTKGGTDPLAKQALLIVGNAEGDHVIGSEVALGMAQYLAGGYGRDGKITEALDTRTFYIVPRLNPDGAELFFGSIANEYSGNLNPRDDDYDWQVDEDGPEDLNGDGQITLMRVKDKEGDWYADEKDPRLMKKKDADTPLDKLYKIYPEGIDNDGDELYNEDGPGGFNINRNFPHNFGYRFRGTKVYPASELETQALIDFLTRYDPEFKTQPRRNICGVLLFSKYDNLAAGTGIECGTPTFPAPPAGAAASGPRTGMVFMMGGRRGQQEAPRTPPRDPQPKRTETRDNSLFKDVSDSYKDITGIKSALSEKPVGSILEYAYFQFGVPAFSANLWSVRQESSGRPQMKMPAAKTDAPQAASTDRTAMMRQMMAARGGSAAGRAGQSSQAAGGGNDDKWLGWIDKSNDGKGFVAWTKYTHKQLGEVEIGGFQPYLRVNPPADQIPELSEKHALFAIDLASQFAEIGMDKPQVKKLSSRLFEIKIKLHNTGDFPYVTAMGQRTRNVTPIVLQMTFEDDESMKLFGGQKRIDLQNLAPGAEREFKWVLISPPGKTIDVSLWARKGGGRTTTQIVLK
jgi:hypothetical protein